MLLPALHSYVHAMLQTFRYSPLPCKRANSDCSPCSALHFLCCDAAHLCSLIRQRHIVCYANQEWHTCANSCSDCPNAIVVAVCLVTLSFHSQINSTTTFVEAQTFPMTALYLTWICYLAMGDARVTVYHVIEAVDIFPCAVHYEAAIRLAEALYSDAELAKWLERIVASLAGACVRLQQQEHQARASGSQATFLGPGTGKASI